jgi:hypothetical protein
MLGCPEAKPTTVQGFGSRRLDCRDERYLAAFVVVTARCYLNDRPAAAAAAAAAPEAMAGIRRIHIRT